MSIGEMIYKHRKKAGLSQGELADLLYVTRQSISLWETDQTLPSTANLVRLTEIFHISMDELCGKETDNESPEAEEYGNAECIAETSTEYTKPLLKSMQFVQFEKAITVCVVFAVFAVLCIIMASITDTQATVAAPAVILAFSIVIIIIIIAIIIRNVRLNLATQPNHRNIVKFYSDYLEIESLSDLSDIKFYKNYSDIKKVKYTKNYVFLFCGNIVTPLIKINLSKLPNTVLELLNIDNQEIVNKNSPVIKRSLSIMFILSIMSIFFALITCAVCVEKSPIPEFKLTMTEYMWVFYLWIPVPAVSGILGFIFLSKKYKCRKNIVAGIIMTALLALYGSFTPMIAGNLKHDFNFVYEIEKNVPISLPDEGYVSYVYDKSNNLLAEAMVKFTDKQEIMENIERDNWITSISLFPAGIIPLYTSEATKTYDYFYLYDFDCHTGNNYISDNHTGHTFIYFAYSEKSNIMSIVCFSI